MAVLEPFATSEFENRLSRSQALMADARVDALLISSLSAFRYFSGYNPIIAESPARPWFMVLPAAGDPIAVIPAMGFTDMHAVSWVSRIETWPSPRPDDEGVSLLLSLLRDLPSRYGKVGAELGPETRLGMSVADFEKLQAGCEREFTDGSEILRQVRVLKSPGEITRMRHAATCAGAAFDAVPDWIRTGMSEHSVHRTFQANLLNSGIDYVRYLAIGSGAGGYESICRGPVQRELQHGDIIGLDTGATVDGYFCDYNRNFSLGPPNREATKAYTILHEAINAALLTAQPGVTCGDLWHMMMKVLSDAGAEGGSIGRMGHGLGMALTEQPSIHPDDYTVIEPGMALTFEPGLTYQIDGQPRLMVHEENVVVREDGVELISPRAAPEITVII
jgi:Xaa-Pro dipeptidase